MQIQKGAGHRVIFFMLPWLWKHTLWKPLPLLRGTGYKCLAVDRERWAVSREEFSQQSVGKSQQFSELQHQEILMLSLTSLCVISCGLS